MVHVVDQNGLRTRNGLRLDRALHERNLTDSQISDPLTTSQRRDTVKKAENINVRYGVWIDIIRYDVIASLIVAIYIHFLGFHIKMIVKFFNIQHNFLF